MIELKSERIEPIILNFIEPVRSQNAKCLDKRKGVHNRDIRQTEAFRKHLYAVKQPRLSLRTKRVKDSTIHILKISFCLLILL